VLNKLGLEGCKDTRIGSDLVKGVSGGERKRTSIGVELITDPNLLLLDEPTSGLDSSSALKIIKEIRSLAR
jgi:ABC-type multidrug transport system ATPase subunit